MRSLHGPYLFLFLLYLHVEQLLYEQFLCARQWMTLSAGRRGKVYKTPSESPEQDHLHHSLESSIFRAQQRGRSSKMFLKEFK